MEENDTKKEQDELEEIEDLIEVKIRCSVDNKEKLLDFGGAK